MKDIKEEFEYFFNKVNKIFDNEFLMEKGVSSIPFISSTCFDIFSIIEKEFKTNKKLNHLRAKVLDGKSYLSVNIKVYPGERFKLTLIRNGMKGTLILNSDTNLTAGKTGLIYEHTYEINHINKVDYLPLSVVVVYKDDNVLTLKRALTKEDGSPRHNGGKWEFVGGKVELDKEEDYVDCALRELSEELCFNASESDLDVVDFKIFEYDSNNKFYAQIFVYEYDYQLIMLSSEHDESYFVDIDEANEDDFLDFSVKEVMNYIRT